MKILFAGLLLLWSCSVAMATDIFDEPCRRYGVPKALVLAIAQTESSLSPWVINIAGQDYHPQSREEALRFIYTARARGLSHDIGVMQINNWWLKQLNLSPETVIEPRNNALIGTWILAQEIRRHGYNWKAVGAYHSPNPQRALRYAHVVLRRARR